MATEDAAQAMTRGDRKKRPRFIDHIENCPKIENHTGCPTGYLAWHEWADEMSKTHRCTRCPDCGYWAIWVPKKAKVS